MKVNLTGYAPLKRALELEGDEIVTGKADLVLDERLEGQIPLLDTIGVNVAEDGVETFRVIKWFSNKEWSPQTMIGIPLPTLMNDNLGANLISGIACRFVKDSYDDIFSLLTNVLSQMNYRGFITLSLGHTKKLINISLGAGLVLYNVLEGIRGKVSEFLLNGDEILESWTVSIIISRYPYPFKAQDERLWIDLSSSAEKHLWFFNLEQHRKSFFTDDTKVCIATAWANSVNEMARRVLRTAEELQIPQAQYRTDISSYISSQWSLYETILR